MTALIYSFYILELFLFYITTTKENMSHFHILVLVGLICFPMFSLNRGTSSPYSYSSKSISFHEYSNRIHLDMNINCGSTIVLNGDKLPGVYFSFSSSNYAPNVDCTLTIKGSTTNQRIIVVIDKIDISCHGDKLIIYDGKKETNSILNPNESLQCGTKKYYVKVRS